MSLKSGMKLEITNALNTLSSLTKLETDNVVLAHCPELLDILLDLAEDTSRSWKTRDGLFGCGEDDGAMDESTDCEAKEKPLLFSQKDDFDTYRELFEASVDEACHLMELGSTGDRTSSDQHEIADDEDVDMSSASQSGSANRSFSTHEWSSNKDQFLSLSNTLRNLSFLPANFQFLARHPRFLQVLKGTVLSFQMRGLRLHVHQQETTVASHKIKSEGSDTSKDATMESDDISPTAGSEISSKAIRKPSLEGAATTEWLPPTGALTILEHRKDVLTILSHLAGYMTLPDSDTAQWVMLLLLDFLQTQDTYYASLALEVIAKLGISHENRVLLASVDRDLRMAHLKKRHGGKLPSRTNGSNKHQHPLDDNTGDKWEQGGFLLPLFQSLSAMVAQALTVVTSQTAGITLSNSTLAHLEMLMLAMFNLAVLSEPGFKRYMVLQPGFVSGLLRLGVLLADIRTPAYTSVSMRTVETVRVIAKDNESLLVQFTEMIAKAAMQPYIHPKVLDDLMCVL
ncbi:MAG: hypothetical protein BYD32DRAFT_173136 [Podila humilis]|nr:MAG: hypothetical protein BYD32DRAFT_173136 [Podila humilis]